LEEDGENAELQNTMKKLLSRIFGVRLAANEDTKTGTGKTTDYEKMVKSLLGLGEAANEDDVMTAFNTAMATEADEDDKVIRSKVAGMEKANEELTTKLNEKETLAANEQTARKKAEQEKADMEKRANQAEGAFANERQARIKMIVGEAVKNGQLTAAEAPDTEKNLANSKDFDADVLALSKKGKILHTTSSTDDLGTGRNKGVKASEEFANEVGKTMRENPKFSYDQAWKHVSATDKGKALMAEMHKPESGIPQKKAA
jgi:hypothetical protein